MKKILSRVSGGKTEEGFLTAEDYGVDTEANKEYLEDSAKAAQLPGMSVVFNPGAKMDVKHTVLEEAHDDQVDYDKIGRYKDITIHKKSKTVLF